MSPCFHVPVRNMGTRSQQLRGVTQIKFNQQGSPPPEISEKQHSNYYDQHAHWLHDVSLYASPSSKRCLWEAQKGWGWWQRCGRQFIWVVICMSLQFCSKNVHFNQTHHVGGHDPSVFFTLYMTSNWFSPLPVSLSFLSLWFNFFLPVSDEAILPTLCGRCADKCREGGPF